MNNAFDRHWQLVGSQWQIRSDTVYLNHGSFGPSPQPVLAARRDWQSRLDAQPMDFYVRLYETAWLAARDVLARLLDTDAQHLVFCENATAGMNVVAHNFPLQAGDEVLLTDHEYGAVFRIWREACERSGAVLKTVELPCPLEDPAQVVGVIQTAMTDRTRLIVVSHITSATALILPVADICRAARQAGVATCIDGPHAPLQVDVSMCQLGCDFYTASCHKWLCAPLGSGFLYVDARWQPTFRPLQLSWGRIQPVEPQTWFDEFVWSGTRDPSAYLAIPAAIGFFQQFGIAAVRAELYQRAAFAFDLLRREFPNGECLATDQRFYGTMAHVPLPDGDALALQRALWERYRIEIPIIAWKDKRYVRVSTHLYNTVEQLETLVVALRTCLS
jgi:isopenicillin-N epimerase